MRDRAFALLAGLAAVAVTLVASHFRSTPYDNDVYLAQAFLQGHAWIVAPPVTIDALPYAGKYFVIEGPAPAVLLMPFVAIFGLQANETLLAIAMCGVTIGATWLLGTNLGLTPARNVWMCAFFLLGTALAWCAMLGDVWFVAHVCAAAFTMLALVELTGKRRGWLVGLWAFAAIESRATMALAVPVYAYLLLDGEQPRRRLLSMAAVLAPAFLVWIGYNEVRWGTWNDIGYTLWFHLDRWGQPHGSPFSLAYLPYQLYSFFIAGPHLEERAQIAQWPYFTIGQTGIALTFSSPALIFAALARTPPRLVRALWIAAALTFVPNLLYYLNGWAQFGMRHALDFEPFLIALMILAARAALPVWVRGLMLWSIAVGTWGIWYWNTAFRQGN